jgi:hypothetical protein
LQDLIDRGGPDSICVRSIFRTLFLCIECILNDINYEMDDYRNDHVSICRLQQA